MNILKRLIKDRNVLALSAHGARAASGMLSFVLLARLLDQHELGAWVLYLSASSFLDTCRQGVTKTPLIRYVSGQDSGLRSRFIGAGWFVSTVVTVVTTTLVLLWGYFFPFPSGFTAFITYYPILGWSTIAFHIGKWISESKDSFGIVLIGNLTRHVLFSISLFLLYIYPQNLSLNEFIMLHIFFAFATTVLFVVFGWSHISCIRKLKRPTVEKLVSYGKYSIGTLLGSSLLRGSDTYLIEIFVGSGSVAIYNVAQKSTQLVEIPLQALSTTAFPKMSKLAERRELSKLKKYFYNWTTLNTIFLIPFLLVIFIWSQEIVTAIGGPSYKSASGVLKWFTIYLLFSPLSRALGMILDSIEKPNLNFFKILVMLSINVVGDIFALYYFSSIEMVALVTTATLITSILIGYYYVDEYITLR